VAAEGGLPEGHIRASDAERNKVAEELRIHCQDGRITVEELEERIGQAMAARTIHQLAEVVADLPPLASPGASAPAPVAATARGLGVRPFSYRIIFPAGAERTREVAFNTITPALDAFGYALERQSSRELEFGREERPVAAIVAAIVLFPIGLLALLVRRELRVVVSLESRGPHETVMLIHGQAPRSVRESLAGLSFG
jgi:hypothetical protein